jgi:hypothetical protein
MGDKLIGYDTSSGIMHTQANQRFSRFTEPKISKALVCKFPLLHWKMVSNKNEDCCACL